MSTPFDIPWTHIIKVLTCSLAAKPNTVSTTMHKSVPFFGLFVAVLLWTCPVHAANFSYTYLEVSFGKIWLDEKITVAEDEFETFFLAGLNGSGRLPSGFVIGGNATFSGNRRSDTWISLWEYVLIGAFPITLSPKIDIVPQLGVLTTRFLTCTGDKCNLDNDIGLAYGIGLRAWAIKNRFEISGGWNDTTNDLSNSTVHLGAALWWHENHSIRLNANIAQERSTGSLSYRYSAFWE